MVYQEDDPNCPIKPIRNGTPTLFGFFDRAKVAKQVKDASELKAFENVLNSGVYMSKHQHGGSNNLKVFFIR